MRPKENWRNIKNFPGYQVSNLGRVRSIDRTVLFYKTWSKTWYPKKIKGTIYKLQKTGPLQRYVTVSPRINGKNKCQYVHKLVAACFVKNPNNKIKTQVNHIDGNKLNNRADNLEWVSPKENGMHASIKGLVARGNKHPHARLTEKDIKEIRKLNKIIRHKIIAEIFNISEKYVGEIVNHRAWSWLR